MATTRTKSGNTKSPRPFLSPAQIADRWGCSTNKVRLMIAAGDFRVMRVGRLVRVPIAEVEGYERRNLGAC